MVLGDTHTYRANVMIELWKLAVIIELERINEILISLETLK